MVKDSTQQISATPALISLNVNNRQEGREREENGIRREEGGWVFVVEGEGINTEPINPFHLKTMQFYLNQKNIPIFTQPLHCVNNVDATLKCDLDSLKNYS